MGVVVQHVKAITSEIFDMFTHFCQPSHPEKLTADFARDEVDVPSCLALRAAGLETYYGNINLLMAEAWRGKIIPSLQTLSSRPELLQPAAELLVVREPADGMAAGAIYISQLLI